MRDNIKHKVIHVALLALCFVALIGYILPLMNIDINIANRHSYSMDINIKNIFSLRNGSDSSLGGVSSSGTNMSELLSGNADLSNITGKLIVSVGLYLAAFILLAAIFVCTLTKKLKKINNFLLVVSLFFYIYIGYAVSNLTVELINSLEQNLGFFAMFFNISDMVNITLKSGYWLTVSAICFMVLINIINFAVVKRSPQFSQESPEIIEKVSRKKVFHD